MTNDELWNEVTSIFREVLDEDSITLAETTSAGDVPGWDSITHVLLIVGIEKKMRVKFTAGEIQNLQNVGELVALIRAKRT